MTQKNISVGILLNSYSVREWEKQALAKLFEHDTIDATPELIVVNTTQAGLRDSIASHISDLSLWKAFRLITLPFSCLSREPWYSVRSSVMELEGFENVDTVECTPISADGLGNELPQDAVGQLSEVDVAIRFGFGIIKGEALTAPEYGILSYHHGDLTKYRGRPAGFHELINGEETAGVTVQRLNESLDGGKIAAFEEVNIEDADSWGDVLSKLYSVSPDLLPVAVSNSVNGSLEEPDSVGDLYTMPSNLQTLRYISERTRRFFR